MRQKFDYQQWEDITFLLRTKYPYLTKSDLVFRQGTKDDLLEMIAGKLGKSKRKLEEEIEFALSENSE